MTTTGPLGGDTAADDVSAASGPTVAPAGYHLEAAEGPLGANGMARLDAWWRAANYLSVGQIYLLANPLLRTPLEPGHVKPRLLGHWGTTPGLNFVYAHANRVITRRGLDAAYVMGPGHGGPGPNACAWLEGTYTECYPSITRDEAGMAALFRQFSFPGGVPSHCAPNTPGSFHEGGELGYSLLHAYGAALDSPGLTVFCVVGDGEAETGPLAASWHVGKLVNPQRDGAVLPILQLNGYKIANPTLLARIPEDDLTALLRGYGYAPRYVEVPLGSNPAHAHQAMAGALDACLDELDDIRAAWRAGRRPVPVRWPMIVLRSPKGWTGPPVVDGQPVEGTFRAHQVPIAAARDDDDHRRALEAWMRSYRPEELFDAAGSPVPALLEAAPSGQRRMSANPVANGGRDPADLVLPPSPGTPWRSPRPARGTPRRRGCSAPGCVTSSTPTGGGSCSSGPTRWPPTASRPPSRSPAATGWRRWSTATTTSTSRVAWSRCSRSTSARACSRGTRSPAATGCSPATRRSSTSSTPCSTSTPSGSRPPRPSSGGARCRRSPTS